MHRTSLPPDALGLALVLALSGCSLSSPLPHPEPQSEGTVAPATLDFGVVEVGTQKALDLTIGSTGDARLTVTSVAIEGAGADAFAASPTGLNVPAGETGTIEVTFTPLGPSAASTTLTLTTSSKKTPTLVVGLVGHGYVPSVRVEPKTIDFAATVIGTTRTGQVTVTNDGAGPAEVRLPATAIGAFRIAPPAGAVDGAFTLETGASATVGVTFAPTTSGNRAASFRVETCSACEPVTVSLSGLAVGMALVVEPSSIDFGAVNAGSTLTRPITFRNVGNYEVQLTGVDVLGPDGGGSPDAAFSVQPGALPIVLDAGTETTVDVAFSPTDDRSHAARVGWASDDPRNAQGTVVVLGRGGGGDIRVTPAVDYGSVAAGTTLAQEVVVTNVGIDELHLLGIEVEGTTAFSITDLPSELTVPAGGSRGITVAYAPAAAGDDTGRLVVTSDDADTPEAVTELRGTGLTLPPCHLQVTPTAGLDFGLNRAGATRSLQFGLTNVGTTGQCLVSGLDLTPDTDAAFTLPDGRVDDLYLEPGETRLVTVDFQPASLGAHAGAVRFYVSDPNGPQVEVPLTGTAGRPEIRLTPDDVDLGTATVGCASAERQICVYDTGSAPANLLSLQIVQPGSGGELVFGTLPTGLDRTDGVYVPAGGRVCFTVRYRPQDPGTDTAAVYVTLKQYAQPFVVTLTGTGTADAALTERFVQLYRRAADVLFVVDNSGSMTDDQMNLGANFGSFLQLATAQGIDYHVAVTSTDCTTMTNPDVGAPNVPGLFWPQDGSRPRIVTPDLPDPVGTFAQNVVLGSNGDSGREAGLQAAFDALSPPLVDDPAKNGGFLRPDASLALVFLSDEEDQSSDFVDTYLAFFRSLKGREGRDAFTASALVEGPGCGTSSGQRYLEMQQRTGGDYESICTWDWAGALERIGRVAFGVRTRFFLGSTPTAQGVQVRIVAPDGTSSAATGWTYDATANAIDFDSASAPVPGDTVEVSYGLACF